jgi:norsolorinic acid ketoreductase
MQVREPVHLRITKAYLSATNSGVQPIASVTPATLRNEIEINTIGPLVLFQAFASLLEASKTAKFIPISTLLGQIEESLPYPYNGYGLSKAGLNYIAKKIDQEVQNVISFPIQ